jgi:L,D-transpeptidase catalytic domain
MRRCSALTLVGITLALAGCGQSQNSKPLASNGSEAIKIELDLKDPAKSFAVLREDDRRQLFKVGYGRLGVTCPGTRFEEGYTPLGRFRVNAILTQKRFEMEPALIAQSGKTEAELKSTLFKNMNSIDFSGDGEAGEYGIGYVSLAPVNSVKQPFAFNRYDGTFRWYSFALHGSNNDQRIGQKVTGGCINLAQPALQAVLNTVKLGDEVVITANGPCTP